jgi:hypothetical protein
MKRAVVCLCDIDAAFREFSADPVVQREEIFLAVKAFGDPGLVGDDDEQISLFLKKSAQVEYAFCKNEIFDAVCMPLIDVDDAVPV